MSPQQKNAIQPSNVSIPQGHSGNPRGTSLVVLSESGVPGHTLLVVPERIVVLPDELQLLGVLPRDEGYLGLGQLPCQLEGLIPVHEVSSHLQREFISIHSNNFVLTAEG